MSWFDKKEENQNPEIPMLPEFPKLPELPRLSEIQEEEEEIEDSPKQIHQLPSFPHNSLGDKFSQNTIKEAIRGKPEETSESYDEIIPRLPVQKMEKSIIPKTKEEDYEQVAQTLPTQKTTKIQEIPSEFKEASMKVKRTEPVFIRLDKFEESLGIFERIKEKIMDIEKMLKETQDIKDKDAKVQEEDNLIHIKFEPDEAIIAKRDFLITEMNLLKIAKIIQRYKQLRIQELKTKIKLQKNFTDIHQDINRLKRILPKIEIPKILQKEEPQPPKEIVKKKYSDDIERQLEEIQKKLLTLQ